MDVEVEDPPAERAHLRDSLEALAAAAPDLGIPAVESGAWRAAASGLGDPVLVMLAGAGGSGKSLLAGAIVGAALEEDADTEEGEEEERAPLVFWKYGHESEELADGDVLERFRPSPALRECAFVEVAAGAFDGIDPPAERAYALADVMLLVFSADDPWGRPVWEFLRRVHKRRERPAAAVVTHADGRTAEELDAIVEYLRGTSNAAIAEEIPVFAVSSTTGLASREGLPDLEGWLNGVAAERPASRQRLERAETMLYSAAEQVARALVHSVDETDAEAECVSWFNAELVRVRDGALAEAAGAMAPARETYQEITARGRGRLARALSFLGAPLTLLRGGAWVKKAQTAAAETAAQRAESGAQLAVKGAQERLGKLSARVREQVVAVFGEGVAEQLPAPVEVGDARELSRRAAARVREAAGDREAGMAVSAMLSANRFWLVFLLLLVGGSLLGAWRFQQIGRDGPALLCAAAAALLALWGAVLLRSKAKHILAHYDHETGVAREAMGRDLESVYGPKIGAAFDAYSAGLDPIRERATKLAADRADLRSRVLQAIEYASERRYNSALPS